jgi:hypothetical protein
MVTPATNWRRVGLLTGEGNFQAFVINTLHLLQDFVRSELWGHGIMEPKYVQDNILVERRVLFKGYFGTAKKNQKMGGSHALSRRTPKRGEEEDRAERARTVQPAWF